MTANSLDYSAMFAKNLPAPSAPPSTDLPPFNFTYGHGSPDLLPIEGFIESATRALRNDGRTLAVYPEHQTNGSLLGYLPMREFLVQKMARHRGINVSTDEVIVTSGSQQGILLVMDSLLEPGDTVITELFSYAGTLVNLRRRNVNIVGVPLDEGGMRMDRLEATLSELQGKGVTPKFIYTIPTLHNPTGTTLSMDRRREMLRLSQKYGVPIFEDECYADLIFEREYEHAIRSLDDSNFVLHVGSFSKSLAPGVRLGYVVAPWQVMGQMLALKTDIGTGTLSQMVVADFLEHNFESHMDHLRSGLERKRDTMMAALGEHFGPLVHVDVPRGGMFLWVRFPENVDVRTVVAAAREQGVAYNSGPEWAAYPEDDSRNGHNYVRLCYALPTEEQTWEGMERMAKAFHQVVGIP